MRYWVATQAKVGNEWVGIKGDVVSAEDYDKLHARAEQLESLAAISPELVWMRLLEMLNADNGCSFTVSYCDFDSVRDEIKQLIEKGFFSEVEYSTDLDSSYWVMVGGSDAERELMFGDSAHVLHSKLDEIFERPEVTASYGKIKENFQ